MRTSAIAIIFRYHVSSPLHHETPNKVLRKLNWQRHVLVCNENGNHEHFLCVYGERVQIVFIDYA